jgi:hypothetical protein
MSMCLSGTEAPALPIPLIQNSKTKYKINKHFIQLKLQFTLISVLSISLSPKPKPTSGCSVPIPLYSILTFGLRLARQKQIVPETLGNDVSQSPYEKLHKEYPQTHLFTNTLPLHHIHQHLTPPFSNSQTHRTLKRE